MQIKKLFPIVVALIILIAMVAGCTQQTTAPATTTAPAATTTAPAQTYKLVWEGSFTPKHKTWESVEQLVKLVNEATGNRIKLEIHPGGEPVPIMEAMAALDKGTIDVLSSTPTYYSGQVPLADFMLVPGNVGSFEDLFDVLYNTEVGKILEAAYEKNANAKVLCCQLMGSYDIMVSHKAKKIRTVDDFKGIKLGASGGASLECVRLLGGHNVTSTGTGTYEVMDQGILDARFLSTYTLEVYSLAEVCHQVLQPHVVNAAGLVTWFNMKKWDSLPADIQKAFMEISRSPEYTKWQIDQVKAYESGLYEKAVKENGVEIYTFPPAEVAKFKATVAPVWDWWIDFCGQKGFKAEAQQIVDFLKKRW